MTRQYENCLWRWFPNLMEYLYQNHFNLVNGRYVRIGPIAIGYSLIRDFPFVFIEKGKQET